MSTTPSISHRIGEAIFTVSSICEEGLATAGEITHLNLTYSASIWFAGKLFDGCDSLGHSGNLFQPGRCQADDQALQTAITAQLVYMSLLVVAMGAKCASSAFVHKKID